MRTAAKGSTRRCRLARGYEETGCDRVILRPSGSLALYGHDDGAQAEMPESRPAARPVSLRRRGIVCLECGGPVCGSLADLKPVLDDPVHGLPDTGPAPTGSSPPRIR